MTDPVTREEAPVPPSDTPIFDQLYAEWTAGPDTEQPRHRLADEQPDPLIATEGAS